MSIGSLNIMQFNIEYGGLGVDFGSVAKAIEAAGADIVAVQEGCGQMARVAADLGWPYFDTRTQVVSRFPLLNPGSGDGEPIYVELEPGRVIAVINVHPPSRAYGPNRLAKGVPLAKVRRRELKVRTQALRHSLVHAAEVTGRGVPVILLGDFNTPSHRDWTDETIGLRAHLRTAFAWPTTVAAEAAGLVDVYRRHHPDPTDHQGLTWPADRPFVKGYNPAQKGQDADRIDLMFANELAHSTSVRIVGETGSEYSDIGIDPWPSDHRALVATFELTPGPAPDVISAASAFIRVGDDVRLRYHAADAAGGSIVRVDPDEPSGSVSIVAPLESASGSVDVPAATLGAGQHHLVLRDRDERELTRTSVWVAEVDTVPTLTLGRREFAVDEGVDVRWENAPGNRADWVAVFDRGGDPATAKRKVWTYTGATVTGEHLLDGSLQPRRWPLPPGEYTVHLLLDDVWDSLAHADFTVVDE